MDGILRAWGKILAGQRPALSVEITRECPLRCAGCYAFLDDHLGESVGLRQLGDFQGQALVDRFFQLIDKHDPLHVSIIGGEPLVRYRELNQILPRLAERGVHTHVVTSAVRPIPQEWKGLRNLEISVSIDGLQPEHDVRRTPATYDRILKHVVDHQISVHCTVTRQQVRRAGYLEEFVRLWSANDAVRKILVSLYTGQVGEMSDELLTPADRSTVVSDLLHLRERFPKLHMPRAMIAVYADPPASPEECVFSQMTTCVSADFRTRVTPCQFGGEPDCANCGCAASAGLSAIGRHRLPLGVQVGTIFKTSLRVGAAVNRLRPQSSA
jgi:MoaA/NifB/PqqE/SkfB family radical SAM enzyme